MLYTDLLSIFLYIHSILLLAEYFNYSDLPEKEIKCLSYSVFLYFSPSFLPPPSPPIFYVLLSGKLTVMRLDVVYHNFNISHRLLWEIWIDLCGCFFLEISSFVQYIF